MTTIDDPSTTPGWVTNSSQAYYSVGTAETFAAAWQRLLGNAAPDVATADESWDGGDAIYYLFPGQGSFGAIAALFKDGRRGINLNSDPLG